MAPGLAPWKKLLKQITVSKASSLNVYIRLPCSPQLPGYPQLSLPVLRAHLFSRAEANQLGERNLFPHCCAMAHPALLNQPLPPTAAWHNISHAFHSAPVFVLRQPQHLSILKVETEHIFHHCLSLSMMSFLNTKEYLAHLLSKGFRRHKNP